MGLSTASVWDEDELVAAFDGYTFDLMDPDHLEHVLMRLERAKQLACPDLSWDELIAELPRAAFVPKGWNEDVQAGRMTPSGVQIDAFATHFGLSTRDLLKGVRPVQKPAPPPPPEPQGKIVTLPKKAKPARKLEQAPAPVPRADPLPQPAKQAPKVAEAPKKPVRRSHAVSWNADGLELYYRGKHLSLLSHQDRKHIFTRFAAVYGKDDNSALLSEAGLTMSSKEFLLLTAHGVGEPSRDDVEQLAKTLNVPLESLFS